MRAAKGCKAVAAKVGICEVWTAKATLSAGQRTTDWLQRRHDATTSSQRHDTTRHATATCTAMAENAPPASASNAASDASRGMPYYERLRRDLRESLQKKRLVDNNLVRAPPAEAEAGTETGC
jgi:hypothetical protein